MRVVLGFVGGLIAGFLTLLPASRVLAGLLGLLGFDFSLEGPFVMIGGSVLFLAWPLLWGAAGVWVASRQGGKGTLHVQKKSTVLILAGSVAVLMVVIPPWVYENGPSDWNPFWSAPFVTPGCSFVLRRIDWWSLVLHIAVLVAVTAAVVSALDWAERRSRRLLGAVAFWLFVAVLAGWATWLLGSAFILF